MDYVLSNDHLEVGLSDFGAAMTSIKDKDGMEYLWQGDATYWSGQAPILFPFCGSIRNDTAQTESGESISLPRHGMVRKREFACDGIFGNQAVFSTDFSERTLAVYPYEFKLTIKYKLDLNRIRTTFVVENRDVKDMPYLVGGHPGFRCPREEGETYEDYYVAFDEEETCDVPTPVTETGLIDMEHRTPFLNNTRFLGLSHELFARDAVILDKLKSRSVTLCSYKNQRRVKVDFEGFPYLILWSSANSGPFVALEPWLGLSTCSDEDDVFEHKRNCQILKPGEEREHFFDIIIE